MAGFNLEFPIKITLRRTPDRGRLALLMGLRAVFSARNSGQNTEVCCTHGDQIVPGGCTDSLSSLRWSGALADLAAYEKLRDCERPSFNVVVSGEVYFLREEPGEYSKLETAPQTFTGHGAVEYSAEIWAKALRALGVSDIVTVQVPLPASSPTGWEPVWVELSNAKAALERGGTTAYRDAAVSVRLALEEWRKFEPVNASNNTVLRNRSKRERIDDLRLHLKNYADLSAHTGIEDWSRDDVVLMISTLAALIAVRNP